MIEKGSTPKACRLKNQLSLGTIQQILSGSVPWSSKCSTASIPVLPPPTTMYRSQGRGTEDRPFTGTKFTPSATPKFGLVVAGTLVSVSVASTSFLLTVTWYSREASTREATLPEP